MIKSIGLKNFELFKLTELTLDKINIISGVNLDDSQASSNGSGKSTLAKNAITFCLYGDVVGINLKDLIRIGTKEAEITLVIQKGNDAYKIVRTIPAGLTIALNGKEIEGNTNTIKQKYIDERFGDYEFFKKFRMIDSKGINLLDLGITNLRKELMNFVDDLFTGIRKKLLADKLTRETFNIDKRLYKFSLSPRRLNVLEKGCRDIKITSDSIRREIESHQIADTKINSEYSGNKKTLELLTENYDNNLNMISKNVKNIAECNQQMTFDADTSELEAEQDTIESLYDSILEDREILQKNIEAINMKIYSINETLSRNSQDNIRVHNEITELNNVELGTRCDKCGSIVDKEHREKYKEDKYKILVSLDYEQAESKESLKAVEIELINKREELLKIDSTLADLRKNVDENNKLIKKLNSEKAENAKYSALLDTYTKNNASLNEDNLKIDSKIKELRLSISKLEKELQMSVFITGKLNSDSAISQNKLQKTQEYLMKLKEAFKFIDYKYTAKDVLLYAEAVRVLDSFAGYYINEWLSQLAVIMNDLLRNVNMHVEFNADKEFIKIKNGENELKYEQLSSGQKCFLSSVFKLAILLHKGEDEGIIIADEGLGNMDAINFVKFLEICKTLPYQYFIIYQNLPDLEEVNKINITRKNGESTI